jgi:CspA family cold shock protein
LTEGTDGMKQGKCVFFDQQRGYGFIRPATNGEDIFVHVSECEGRRELNVGDLVDFEIATHRGKPAARNVSVLVPQAAGDER